MSDERIRNVSDLERALNASFPQTTPQPQPIRLSRPPSRISTPTPDTPSTPWSAPGHDVFTNGTSANVARPSSKERTATYQNSTHHLLMNLSGLQTTTNTKLDILTDSILRLTKAMETIANEQRKQTDLLTRIVSNTAELRIVHENSGSKTKSGKQLTHKCKDYGFNNGKEVLSEFIMTILKQAEVQIKSRGFGYRSSRTMERRMLDKAIKVLSEVDYRINGEVKPKIALPSTDSEGCIYLASRIGSLDSIKPVLTPTAITELFNDPACRTMTSAVEEIMSRLPVIRWMIPYYEADIVDALMFPYFDSEGHVLCNWGKLTARDETPEEAEIFNAKVPDKEMLGKLLISGQPFDRALKVAIRRK
jgi:hypothetical protein